MAFLRFPRTSKNIAEAVLEMGGGELLLIRERQRERERERERDREIERNEERQREREHPLTFRMAALYLLSMSFLALDWFGCRKLKTVRRLSLNDT